MTEKKKSITDNIWDALASVKLAIIIFALISLTSVVGTVIEQNADPQKNIQIIAKFVGFVQAPAVYNFVSAMGFVDMYNSWWFKMLLALFATNLIICSIDKFPPIWRLAREKLKPLKDENLKAFPVKKEFLLKGSESDVKNTLSGFMGDLGFKKYETFEDEEGWQIFAQRQQFSRLGVYVTHLSIIVIMLGAVVGFFFGFNGYLNIPEGMSYPIAFARKQVSEQDYNERNMLVDALLKSNGNIQQAAGALGVSEERYTGRLRHLGAEPMGFSIKNADFDVSFYGNSDMAKEYMSQLVIYENGSEIMSKNIEVNSPLKYKGYTFYQASYGLMENTEDFVFSLNVQSPGSMPQKLNLKMGDSFTVPGTGMTATLQDFSPALRFDASGKPSTYADQMSNPGLQLKVGEGEGSYLKWVLKRYPQTWIVGAGVQIQFLDVWGAQFTGLQVRRDPGVWMVYLGCMIMSLGLFMAFFTSHRRVWIKLTRDGGKSGLRVRMAASAHKGREGMERNIDRMITLLTEGGE